MNNGIDKDSIYYTVIESLIKKIKARYKGGVNVRIIQNETDNYCEIKIIRIKDLGFIFTYKIHNICNKLLNNYTINDAINELDKAYRAYAINLTLKKIYVKENKNVQIFSNVLSKEQEKDMRES